MTNSKMMTIAKRRRRRCPVPKSTFTTYMDEGVMHYRAGRYRKSLYCFDRALELNPTHQAALVARSQCHLKLGDAASALKDAETSFEKNTTYLMGLYQYAEALFNLGQFERSLIAYNRGYRLRRDMEGFRIGIQKSQEAIRRAIGDRQATQIEDLEIILPQVTEIEQMSNQKTDHCCLRPNSNEETLERRLGIGKKAPSKARARWVDREVLGQLQKDKDYLSKFLSRPDIQGEQSGGSETLRSSAIEALKYLEIREHFWRQQNPMYARKTGMNFNNDMVLQYELEEKEKQEASRKIRMDAAEGAVQKNLSLIAHALKMGRAKDCQLECERTMRQMKEISTRLLPKKPVFMSDVLHYKGLALMKQKLYDQAVTTFHQELAIAVEHRMLDVKIRAMNYVGKANASKGAFTDAAEIWDNLLSISKQSSERAYLCHEIGRCYLETNKPEICRFYGNQSVEEAQRIDDHTWAMNAHILLGQCEVTAQNLESAGNHFYEAAERAAKSGNKAFLALLTEAQQCIRVWIDKLANAAAAEENDTQRMGSDDSFEIEEERKVLGVTG